MADNSFSFKAMEKSAEEAFIPEKNVKDLDDSAEQLPASSQTSETMRLFFPASNNNLDLLEENQGNYDSISFISGQVNVVNISLGSILEQCQNEPSSTKEAKNAKYRR